MNRRLTFGQPMGRLDDLDSLGGNGGPVSLPIGSEKSKLLNEEMLLRLAEILPARAQGYSWILVRLSLQFKGYKNLIFDGLSFKSFVLCLRCTQARSTGLVLEPCTATWPRLTNCRQPC